MSGTLYSRCFGTFKTHFLAPTTSFATQESYPTLDGSGFEISRLAWEGVLKADVSFQSRRFALQPGAQPPVFARVATASASRLITSAGK